MASTGDPARQRLRTILYTRRVELGFANRQDFASDPATRISYSVIRDLESPRGRANFDEDTLLRADLSYRFKPGSIQAFLSGGAEPEPLPAGPPPPAADQAAGHLRRTPGASDAEIAAYLEILRAFTPARDAQQRRQRR